MPLSAPAKRKKLHTRAITFDGYQREDGLWDVEGYLTDVKTYGFDNRFRGRIEPGTPIHEMWVRVTLDDHLVIQDIETKTDNGPFEICPAINADYKKLIGLKVGKGWRRGVLERMGGVKGCTHITEMLFPLATVVIQSVMPMLSRKYKKENGDQKKSGPSWALLKSCHAYAPDSPVVKEFFPEQYTGD